MMVSMGMALRGALPAGTVTFTVGLGLLGLALVCSAFAWDGLVRREVLLHAFPSGGGSVTLRRVRALLLGLGTAALGIVCLLFAWGFYRLSLRACAGSYTCLVGSVQGYGWLCAGGCAFWFFFVWLRMGDPRKRVLVYGVWYHQETTAHVVARRLTARGLSAPDKARLYALEQRVVSLLHELGWLVHGKTWLDGGKRTAREAPLATVQEEVVGQPIFEACPPVEREAVRELVAYFMTRAERAKRMSPVARWWVGTAQIGKAGVYGTRAT